jgi:hypothetical protein
VPQKSPDYKTPLSEVIVGRELEMRRILTHIHNMKSLHLYGPEGSGKSALLEWAYTNWKDIYCSPIPIYCRSSRTLRQTLAYISGFLLNYFKHLKSIDKFKRIKEITSPTDIKKLNVRTLKNVIFSYILEDNFFVILDHLEYVTPRINSFLTTLYERVPVISASRQSWEVSDYSFRGRLDYFLYLVPNLRVENLKRKDAFVLMEMLCRNLHIDFPAKQRMFDEVFHISKGNPGVISTIFEKARRPEYQRDNGLNLPLIMIDSEIEDIA